MQDVIATYMDKMIERTTTSLTHSGMEGLSKDKSYLFISNHRDIAMDPAFVNYMLYHADFETLSVELVHLNREPLYTGCDHAPDAHVANLLSFLGGCEFPRDYN
jgi:hypothetical protein